MAANRKADIREERESITANQSLVITATFGEEKTARRVQLLKRDQRPKKSREEEKIKILKDLVVSQDENVKTLKRVLRNTMEALIKERKEKKELSIEVHKQREQLAEVQKEAKNLRNENAKFKNDIGWLQDVSLSQEIEIRLYRIQKKEHQDCQGRCSYVQAQQARLGEQPVLSTLLYSSKCLTSYAGQEERLNSFHLHCLRRLLHIKWQDKVTNAEVLERAGIPSVFMLLIHRRLRWLGHVRRMDDGRIPKDMLYGELREGSRPVGRPKLRFKDVCKRDMKKAEIDPNTWEELADIRVAWQHAVSSGVGRAENTRSDQRALKKTRRKTTAASIAAPSSFVCVICNRLPLQSGTL
ncbi:hypothetical protein ACROYT_G044108 [Oculina patagonica]